MLGNWNLKKWDWWEQKLANVGGIVAFLMLIGSATLGQFATTNREMLYASSLVVGCGAVALLFGRLRGQVGKESRYAHALRYVQESVRPLTDELSSDTSPDDRSYSRLQETVDRLADAFAEATGAACRVCVKKVTGSADRNPAAKTVCRSGSQKAGEADGHPIAANTDFNQLWQDESQLWYLGNDLLAAGGRGEYNNSRPGWRDDYRASAVWPIRRVFADANKPQELIGFLCVDCKRANVFSSEYDYPLGAIVAAVLYPFLGRLGAATREETDGHRAAVQQDSKKAVIGGA